MLCVEFGHYLSLNVGQFETPSSFTDEFCGQLHTLQDIEEEDRRNEAVVAQVIYVESENLENAY